MARPRALGRSAGSFPVVLFSPRERHTEEVCPLHGGSVESVYCLGREQYDLFPYCIESIKREGPPPIALAITYGISTSHPQGRLARPEWAQRSALIRITLGGLSLLPDLERYYESSIPDSIARLSGFTGTTKSLMLTHHYRFQWTVAPPTRKGINMETSLPFGSENLWRKSGLKFPETARLYSQREYAAPKIIPSVANVATKLFLWEAPTKMRNFPIKLLVPGELILAKVEKKEMVERFGMVLTEPP
ncbi:hypothetical protein IFM89_014179 [Coptis chinensis]|uniref:Uncharacterized protein n=1 Tax=Coptis chinensis TaxID=261450 RepID=A0A835LIK3_9MAGN|nr:hypothetical protein IFM89_014179 [Coptis chinensis]